MNATQQKLAILIVNWNGRDDTLECLESLAAENYVGDKSIWVVDNGSTDDSVAAISTNFPDVRILRAGRNLGFTGGNNLGIEHALSDGADFLLLLNNDTVIEPGCLGRLVDAAAADPDAAIWSPMIHYFDPPREPWFAGSRLDLRRGMAVHDNTSPPPPTAGPVSVPWLSGCAMLITAGVAKRIGGFDDRFFLNWEDVDLSLGAAAVGLQLRLLPTARVYHKVGRSMSKTSTDGLYYSVRNNLLLLDKHLPGAMTRRIAATRVIGRALVDVARALRYGRPWRGRLRAVCRAILDHHAGRYGPIRSSSAPDFSPNLQPSGAA